MSNYHKSKRNQTLKRDNELQKKFGINLPTFEKILEEQNRVCYICEQENNNSGGSLAVDHNHKTGQVRGLLCGNCNRALGLLQDSPDLLRKALTYLERDYIIQSEKDIRRKPRSEQARWRNIVTTPVGVFFSYMEAAEHYGVHPCTIATWCGDKKYDRYNGHNRTDEGFSFEKKMLSLKEAQDIQNENNNE